MSHSPANQSRTTTEPTPEAASEATADPRSGSADPPLDVVYGVLSNQRRRRVLRYLLAESASTTLGELAEHIAAIENDKPERALSSAERKRVYIVLYQCHLPRMDDAGVVDFDEGRKTVEVGDNAEEVTRFLPDEDDGSSGETGGGLVTALATLIGGIPGVR